MLGRFRSFLIHFCLPFATRGALFGVRGTLRAAYGKRAFFGRAPEERSGATGTPNGERASSK